jgi:hypothetical protein
MPSIRYADDSVIRLRSTYNSQRREPGTGIMVTTAGPVRPLPSRPPA